MHRGLWVDVLSCGDDILASYSRVVSRQKLEAFKEALRRRVSEDSAGVLILQKNFHTECFDRCVTWHE
jgi:hypothetical protein